MIPKYILAPLLGGVIGYITNDIAIKMLFHPRKSIYIGKFHIPFTPGLIPQQKARIAKSIGRVVSSQLLNTDTLKNAVLSESAIEKLRGCIWAELAKLSDDPRTVRELLSRRFSEEQIERTKTRLCGDASSLIMKKLLEEHIGAVVTETILEEIQKLLPENKGFSGMIADMLSKHMSSAIETAIDDAIREKGPAIVQRKSEEMADSLLELRLCEIYQSQKARIPQLVEAAAAIYQEVLDANLDRVLGAVNIESIIVEKVSSFDSAQLEDMIFGILNRELKAIVYLGAALGFFMGFINLLF